MWKSIVECRPSDFFSPGNLELLEQYCETTILLRGVQAELQSAPMNAETLKLVKDYTTMCIAMATKLRLTIQSALRGDMKKASETFANNGPDPGLLASNVVSIGKS